MELKLSRKKIRLTFDGLQCEVKIPTTKEINTFQEELKTKGANEEQVLHKFLMTIGLTEEILDAMDVISLRELIDYISGKKSPNRI